VTAEIPREQMEQAQMRLLDRLARLENMLAGLEGSIEGLPEEERSEVLPRLSHLVTRHAALFAAAEALPGATGADWRRAHANLIEDLRQLEYSATTIQSGIHDR
jgi:hypothetical protein